MDTKVSKSGDTMTGLLDTKSYFRTRGRTTRIVEVNSLDNSQTWGTFEVYKDSDTAAHTAIFTFNPSNNNKSSILSVHINGSEIWAQCPASKRQNSIVTSEYMGSNYVRFGNGLQICWFYPQISGSGKSNQTLTLPVAFNNTDYLALVQQTGDSPTNDYTNTLSIMSKTTTNFVIRKAMGESMYLQVLCVGYWY